MAVGKLAPIIEIFATETADSIRKMEECMRGAEERKSYEKGDIITLVNLVRPIRRDASLLLYENMREVSEHLERLLDEYRDVRSACPEFEAFDALLKEYTAFLRGEIFKLTHGEEADGNPANFLGRLKKLTSDFIKAPKEEEEVFEETACKEEEKVQSSEEVLTQIRNEIFSYSLSQDKMNAWMRELKGLREEAAVMNEKTNGAYASFTERLDRLTKLTEEVRMADLCPVVEKCRMIVHEMLAHTGKDAIFSAIAKIKEGECLKIEAYKQGNLAKVFEHLIRNSIDHGIEPKTVRKRKGKPEQGRIHLIARKGEDFNGIKILFRDDGKGIFTDMILREAKEQGLLKKPVEDYERKEIINLLFQKGFTTKDYIGDYSGTGFGLSTVRQLLSEINGTMELDGEEGKGIYISIKLPYDEEVFR